MFGNCYLFFRAIPIIVLFIFTFSLNGRKMLWLANGWKLHISSLYRQGSTMYNGIYNRTADRSISGLQVSWAENICSFLLIFANGISHDDDFDSNAVFFSVRLIIYFLV